MLMWYLFDMLLPLASPMKLNGTYLLQSALFLLVFIYLLYKKIRLYFTIQCSTTALRLWTWHFKTFVNMRYKFQCQAHELWPSRNEQLSLIHKIQIVFDSLLFYNNLLFSLHVRNRSTGQFITKNKMNGKFKHVYIIIILLSRILICFLSFHALVSLFPRPNLAAVWELWWLAAFLVT